VDTGGDDVVALGWPLCIVDRDCVSVNVIAAELAADDSLKLDDSISVGLVVEVLLDERDDENVKETVRRQLASDIVSHR
jgi:hypothetical protein